MPFGPFLSREEKAKINAAQQSNYGSKPSAPTGNLGVGVGPFVSPAQKTQINTSLQQNYGAQQGPPIPKVQVPTGGRSAQKRVEREAAVTRSQTPYVPPTPTESTRGKRRGAAGRMQSSGITIGIPSAGAISTKRPNRSSNTTKADPTQNPERPGQPAGGVETPAFSYYDQARKANPDGGTRNFGEGYKEAELAAGQKAEDYRAGAGFGGQTRVSPAGVVQKGTQTSLSPMTMEEANSLLSGGYTVRDPFSSTQLPASSQSPYANVGPVADGAEYARNLEMQKPGAVTGVGPISDGENYAKNIEAGEQSSLKPTDTAATSQNSGINWGARTAADNSDPNMARRRAFLDAEGSMQGLRRAEATQGIVYAGGQHHMVNPNKGQEGQNDFVSIGDKDDVRGYKSGRLSAQDMKDKYVTKIVDNGITSYDQDKVTDTAGPLADGEAYGKHLQTQQAKYKTSGVGPLADGDAYAKSLRR